MAALDSQNLSAERLNALLYDASVPDWPGEIDFYRALATGQDVLEVACGTGRVCLQLVGYAASVTGVDRSADMLDVARTKSQNMAGVRWLQGDMRGFDAGRSFGLAIIPGHAFQHMLTPEDQATCLSCIKRHLAPGAMLVVHVDHQDVRWLGGLPAEQPGVFAAGDGALSHPITGAPVRSLRAWSYERSTQTAIVTCAWEEIGADEGAVARWEMQSVPLHCVFPFEMEHLLRRVGFAIEALYGDFFRRPLANDSRQMIWVARNCS